MKIACVGWGSLVWRPESLHVRACWFSDGPLLPIEFARESNDRRITLVIAPDTGVVRCLWALMSLTELEAAKKDLALREGLRDDQIGKSIGFVTAQCAPKDSVETEVKRWLIGMGADAAIWTKLQPKIGQEYRKPAIDEVIEHLREKVSPEQRAHAEEYVRRAPRQIDTDYRRRIEFEFGWSPVG